MSNQLKQNIATILKQRGIPIRQFERDAGLHKNFISNFLHNNSQNPSINSIIKIAAALNISIDELIGKESKTTSYDQSITKKEIFFDIVNYLSKAIQNKQNSSLKFNDFFNAIYEIYAFSLKKGNFDKEFADWFINCQL